MKKKVLRVSLFVAAAIATQMAVRNVQAAEIFKDDFSTYADTDALNAVWPVGNGDATQTFLENGPTGSTNTSASVHEINRAGRRDHSFTAQVPTASNPVVVSYDLYDPGTDTGANEYNQILAFNATGGSAQLISMGRSTLVSPGNDVTKYQARVAFNSVNWFNLNASRSAGWHTFTAEIYPGTVNFYVDGTLDSTKTFTASTINTGISQVRLGAGLSSRTETGYYDNVLVTTDAIPEPAALSLLSLSAVGLLARRRRA